MRPPAALWLWTGVSRPLSRQTRHYPHDLGHGRGDPLIVLHLRSGFCQPALQYSADEAAVSELEELPRENEMSFGGRAGG